jgi:DNA-directed RNA polymerase subunit RPC12/RpoP
VSRPPREFSECPGCGSNRLIKGKIISSPYGRPNAAFRPAELKFWTLSLAFDNVGVAGESYVCLDCGLVLGKTDPLRAQECVRKRGTDQLKKRMGLSTEDEKRGHH